MAVAKPKGRLTCEIKLKVGGSVVRFPGVKDRSTSKKIEGRIQKLIVAKTHFESVPTDVLAWVRDLPVRAPDCSSASLRKVWSMRRRADGGSCWICFWA